MAFRYSFLEAGVVIAALLVAACSSGDQGSGRLTEMRCAQDGLCVERVGERSLELAYREGNDEVRLDVIYRRNGSVLGSGRPFAVRMLDQVGEEFFYENCGSNPDAWLEDRRRTSPSRAATLEEAQQLLRVRNHLLVRMKEAMATRQAPVDVDEEAWQEASEQLAGFTANLYRSASSADLKDVAQQDEHPLAVQPTVLRPVETGLAGDSLAPENEAQGPGAGEAVNEELDAHLEFELGAEGTEISEEVGHPTSGPMPKHLNKFDGLKKSNIDYAERYEDANFEYKQELELWNLNAKTFFFVGWPTKKHHSAAKITVLRRPLRTQQDWEVFRQTATRNHGSRAGEKNMHRYAVCTDFPVTEGYFAWKGECDGVWLTGHLCNDDTAYQVWHAYGGWNGGRHCIGKKRGKRPSCAKPW